MNDRKETLGHFIDRVEKVTGWLPSELPRLCKGQLRYRTVARSPWGEVVELPYGGGCALRLGHPAIGASDAHDRPGGAEDYLPRWEVVEMATWAILGDLDKAREGRVCELGERLALLAKEGERRWNALHPPEDCTPGAIVAAARWSERVEAELYGALWAGDEESPYRALEMAGRQAAPFVRS